MTNKEGHTMTKAKSDYPEIEDIRKDIDSLKSNVVELTKHIQENGLQKAEQIGERAKKGFLKLQETGHEELVKVEKHVKDHPSQSLAIAFAAGLAASLLLGRRS